MNGDYSFFAFSFSSSACCFSCVSICVSIFGSSKFLSRLLRSFFTHPQSSSLVYNWIVTYQIWFHHQRRRHRHRHRVEPTRRMKIIKGSTWSNWILQWAFCGANDFSTRSPPPKEREKKWIEFYGVVRGRCWQRIKRIVVIVANIGILWHSSMAFTVRRLEFLENYHFR